MASRESSRTLAVLATAVRPAVSSDAGDYVLIPSPSEHNSLVSVLPNSIAAIPESVGDTAQTVLLKSTVNTRSSCEGDTHRSFVLHAMFAEGVRMPCITGGLGSEDPPPDQRAEETVLTEAEVKELTERFLFGDPAGVKATGPNGAASRATLGLIVTCLAASASRSGLPTSPRSRRCWPTSWEGSTKRSC